MALDTQSSRQAFRELVARFAEPDWIDHASAEIAEAIHRELPELNIDEQIRPSTLASTRSVLRLWTELVRLDEPPDAAQLPPAAAGYARELARRGVAIDTLLRSYQVGNAVFFRLWAARLRSEIDNGDELADAVETGVSWTFEYVGALSRGLVARFTEEREAWVRSAAAMRSEIVSAILAGEPVEPRAAGQRLRYELSREHVAYVVWSDQDTGTGASIAELERIAVKVATLLGTRGPLIVPLGGGLVAGWCSPPPTSTPANLTLGPENPACASVAFGSSAHGISGFADSHHEAMHARRVARLAARRAGTTTRFEDVRLVALATLDMDLARRFVDAELGPLAAQDDDTLRLSATLRVYLEEQGSPRRSAQRLGVHENTIKGRIRTITQLLPAAPSERPGELLVALRLARLTHRTD